MNCELMLTYDTPAYMFNVYKNQLSRQIGSRNLTGPKMLPTIWHTYMKLVTKYQISAINSCWEKWDEKYLGRTEVKQYTPLRWSRGIKTITDRGNSIEYYLQLLSQTTGSKNSIKIRLKIKIVYYWNFGILAPFQSNIYTCFRSLTH